MANGLLEVRGTLNIDQFWPIGTSDADTTKIVITVGADAFRFRASPAEPFRVTHVFDNAIVDGQTDKPAIDKQGRVTVRLQGIDAPELHYRPSAALPRADRTEQQHALYLEWNLEYRQYLAETATDRLHSFLAGFAQNPLACRILSAVDTPDDVFDTYARLVGDVVVEVNNVASNINQWLVEQGLAIPAFYASMSADEIAILTERYRFAREQRAGLWDNRYSERLRRFKWDLVYRGKNAPLMPQKDFGRVIMPKLFRRQATFQVNKRALMLSGSFPAYLAQKNDEMHRVDEFIEQGPAAATIFRWPDLFIGNVLQIDPAELVFRERPSRIRIPGGGPAVW